MAKENAGFEFKLKRIYETKNRLLEEKKHNDLMSKKTKRHVRL